MDIKRFNLNNDLNRLESFLRYQYSENRNMTSWLPERLHDLIFRMDTQYTCCGGLRSSDFIYIWQENDEIAGCILPDGDAVYMSIRNGYEELFGSMVSYAEEHLRPLFNKEDDGSLDFLVIANDSLKSRREYLENNGYIRQEDEDYDNYVCPQKVNVTLELPDGFKLMYGDEYTDEVNKWSACHMGFHPELENTGFRNDLSAYNSRKASPLYKDSFECVVIDKNSTDINDVCSYCFVYVDIKSKTALIEPVSTREPYRHRGFGKAMMHAVMLKCKEAGVEKCYVNSYAWRRKFYNAAGFITEDTIGYYHKIIKD